MTDLWHTLTETTLKPYLDAGDVKAAIAKLLRYGLEHPNDWRAPMALGNLYRVSRLDNRVVHALHYYRLALEIDPAHVPAYENEAELYLDAGDVDRARDRVKTGLFLQPESERLLQVSSRLPQEALPQMADYDIVFYTGHPFVAPLPYPHELDCRAIGGSESMILLMARHFVTLGKRVAIFSHFQKAMRSEGVDCFDIRDFAACERQGTLPVCIVSRYHHPFLRPLRARRRIFWLHDHIVPSCRDLYQSIDPQIDEYWVLSHYQQSSYLNACGLDPKKFWMTTNAVNTKILPERLPRSTRTPTLFYASRPSRGLDLALRVFAALSPRYPELRLNVATYTAYADPFRDPELAPFREALENPAISVRVLGKTDLYAKLSESLCLLYPNTSELETSCLAAIEAMALGTPVLASDRGCLAETVKSGQTGEIVVWDADSSRVVAQLVAHTARLIDNQVDWERLSVTAFAHARTRHDVTAIGVAWGERLAKYLN